MPMSSIVTVQPVDAVERHTFASDGMAAEIVQITTRERLELRFRGPRHLLVVYDQAVRGDGETLLEGLPRSTLRDLTGKLIVVPAGHAYREWHQPCAAMRIACFCFDPARMPAQPACLGPRLFFEDAALLETARKLRRQIEHAVPGGSRYVEALGTVLAHELARVGAAASHPEVPAKGGLAGWQQRAVTTYIEDHLAEPISLATLARLAGLSPCYFCRAFKRSLNLSPHRYHSIRRIEHAKLLLAQPKASITDIGLMVGYGETSSFTTAFHKATGITPTAYRRTFETVP